MNPTKTNHDLHKYYIETKRSINMNPTKTNHDLDKYYIET